MSWYSGRFLCPKCNVQILSGLNFRFTIFLQKVLVLSWRIMNFHIIPRKYIQAMQFLFFFDRILCPPRFPPPSPGVLHGDDCEGGSLLLFLVLSHAGIVFGEPYLRQLSGRCWLLIVGGITSCSCDFLASIWVNQSEKFHGVRVKSLLKIMHITFVTSLMNE